MFYSHEILTSPEHGVATIWLVATLGSKSVTRKVNRKAILDVDVPRACNVIMEPQAPMALRLQGSLLYGVSRVYNQQCDYTLTDVQTIHDRMRSMLKSIAGGGLDPTAGKARPEQLIVPYDPTFLPEIDLAGLGLDLSRFDMGEMGSSETSLVRTKTPDISQSALSQDLRLQLDLSPEDYMKDLGGYTSGTDMSGSVQRKVHLNLVSPSALDEEEGILLQPDFEFDEDGNIIELDAGRQLKTKETKDNRASKSFSESAFNDERKETENNELPWDYQPMLVDDDRDIVPGNQETTATPAAQSTRPKSPSVIEETEEEAELSQNEATMRQTKKKTKFIIADEQIALRNTDLANLNNDYIENMLAVVKQKQQNKMPTLAKKNAAFWVFGQGIGSVGVGMGAARAPHPLNVFSGDELYAGLHPDTAKKGRKRKSPSEDSDSEDEARRVRSRDDEEEQIGRGGLQDDIMQDDVEIGRHGSSALRDDHSSLMPWNITASIKSSRHGSSAAKTLRGLGSASDLSSRGLPDMGSAMAQLAGYGRRNRLTSASPLAGRGFLFDVEGLNELSIPGNDDLDALGDFDMSNYLNMDDDDQAVTSERRLTGKQQAIQKKLLKSSLDEESLNFLDFVTTQLEGTTDEEGRPSTPRRRTSEEITLSTLLPPKETTRSVATHGLMHTLALATKGFLTVHQEPYEDLTSREYGVKYEYGEIYLRPSDE